MIGQIKAFLERIKSSSEKKVLIENFFSLSFLQAANHILPLIALPYLVRILGFEKFGLIAFSRAFISYFVIFTEFGFNLYATREISVNREDRDKVSEIFCSVMLVKIGLALLSFVVMAALVFTVDMFRAEWLIYFLTYGLVVANVLFPVWFFQGMERMKYIAAINIFAKILFVIPIFFFIKQESDYIYVPLISSLGFMVSGAIALWMVRKDFNIKFHIPAVDSLINVTKKSFHFLLSRISVSIYTSSSAFFLGLFTGNLMVGYYSAAEKIYMAIQRLYQPLVNAIYPFMAKTQKIKFFKKVFKLSVIGNLVFVVTLAVLSGWLIRILFGSEFIESIMLLKIFSVALLVSVPSILLGYPFLAALGHTKWANNSVMIGSIFHLVGLIVLSQVSINIFSVAVLVVMTESIVLLVRVYGVRKFQLWRTG